MVSDEYRAYPVMGPTISDIWFQAVYGILDHGKSFVVDEGSFKGQTRLEYDYFSAEIFFPHKEPILPVIPAGCNIPPPVTHEYVYGGEGVEQSYIETLITNTKAPNEDYTYGERIHWQYPIIIDTYKKKGFRNNQMIIQVAGPEDIYLKDPPCLRHIDTRIQNNKLHFFVYFRSWDLWSGLPANLAGIVYLQQIMANEIGVEVGKMFVESKGLHIYGFAKKFAELRCMKYAK
jgi:thymidylate synthase